MALQDLGFIFAMISLMFTATATASELSHSNQCSGNFHVFPGQRLASNQTQKLNITTKLMSVCATSCLHDPKCLSFNFARISTTCELNYEECGGSDDKCIDDEEYTYYARNGKVTYVFIQIRSFVVTKFVYIF